MTDAETVHVETGPGHGPVKIEVVERITKGDAITDGALKTKDELDDPAEGAFKEFGPGFMAIYICDVFDTEGRLIGNSAGSMTILGEDPETGHLLEHITEQIKLPDGNITAWGTMDRSDVMAQKWVTYRAEGTSGRYLGMTGTRSYRINSFDDPAFPLDGIWELS
jgi:hypothetical protein